MLVLLGFGAVVCNGSVCGLARFVRSEVVQRAIEALKERVATAGRKALRLARPSAERRRNKADMVRLCVVICSTIVNYKLEVRLEASEIARLGSRKLPVDSCHSADNRHI